jgi:redox-sensing transcriptional repressor
VKKLPEKTIERLSKYRRTLLDNLTKGKTNIYSHELALFHNLTAVQVRRDFMFIGYSSSQKKGYDIRELVDVIGKVLDTDKGQNVAVIGIGNLGMAVTSYFNGKRSKLNIVAAFDVDPNKISTVISGVKVYPLNEIEEIIKKLNISVAILTVPIESAAATAAKLVMAGIKGILNFTTFPLNVPDNVYHEDYDMITSLEKVAYFVKNSI